MNFIIASSNIASNVGNDFFYRGVEHVLSTIIPNLNITKSYFLPINAYKLNDAEASNNFDLFKENGNYDGIIISGPVLDRDFVKHFENALVNAKKNKIPIYFLSVGGRQYDEDEIAHCNKLLNLIKPDIFISRDYDTYNNYKSCSDNSYDGICFAHYVNDYFQTIDIDLKYITSCFDFSSEPNLLPFVENEKLSPDIKSHGTRSLKNRLKYILQRELVDSVNEYKIIRPCHRPIRNKKAIFFKKNVVSSFISDPYLSLYSNTSLTVTDRLHAAVVTLMFGKSACLALNSNRTRLLEKTGLNKCINKVYKLTTEDNEKILDLKNKQIDFLRECFRKN